MDDARTPEELALSLDRRHAEICAASAALLEDIAAFDGAKLWKRDGATSMTAWLCARYGLEFGGAREWVRVGRALRGLPALGEAYRRGRISFDQLRPLTRLADRATDEAWAERGAGMEPTALWLEVRRGERVSREQASDDHRMRYVRTDWDDERRFLHLEGVVAAEQGAALQKALSKAAEAVSLEDGLLYDPHGARMADALVGLATSGTGTGEGETLVVHAGAEVLAEVPENGDAPNGRPHLAETEDGVRLPDESIRRMACDAKIEWVLEREGRTVGIGRRRRGVPQWLRSHLAFRDRGCRFPGCGRDRWVKAHHLVHWARGGPTDAGNLVLLCHAHHRLIHEGGWGLGGDPEGDLTWVRPNGGPLETGAGLARAGPAP